MAVLSDQDRKDVWADLMRRADLNVRATPAMGSILKADLRAAVDAIDDYLNTNAATINSAIPQPARGVLSQQQKAALLMFVIAKRYLSGS